MLKSEKGSVMTFLAKQEHSWMNNSELPGAIITMHDYIAGVTKDEIEAELKPQPKSEEIDQQMTVTEKVPREE